MAKSKGRGKALGRRGQQGRALERVSRLNQGRSRFLASAALVAPPEGSLRGARLTLPAPGKVAPKQTGVLVQRPPTRRGLRPVIGKGQLQVPGKVREAICSGRKSRRQVLFATGRTAKGAGSRKSFSWRSLVRC